MKKRLLPCLLAITCIFAAFTFGFFLGRNQNHESIRLSTIRTDPQNRQVPVPTHSHETVQPEIIFPVDINSADVHELSALPGIGETLAQRILNYRNAHGNFDRPEELMNVEGIGSGKLEMLLDYVTTGG